MFKPGDDILYQDGFKYRIVHISEKIKDDGHWVNQYGACRLRWNEKPDRRFLRVPGPDEQIGRFKVFILREDYMQEIKKKEMKGLLPTDKRIYPDVKVEAVLLMKGGELPENTFRVTLETYLRKKYKKKYYLWRVWKEYYTLAHELSAASVADGANRFHEEVYRSLILGKISLNIEVEEPMMPRRKLFELDPDQTSEKKRLKIGHYE
jgi:hypothetical protein